MLGSEVCYAEQEAVEYTSSQVRDFLHLRRLFYARLGQLSRERQALLKQMPEAGITSQLAVRLPVKIGLCHARYAQKALWQSADADHAYAPLCSHAAHTYWHVLTHCAYVLMTTCLLLVP